MHILLSPAKTLDFETPPPSDLPLSKPLFSNHSAELIAVLRNKSVQELAELMDLSDKLAELNVGRYQAWRKAPKAENVRPAMWAFNGDVYAGLQAHQLDSAQWEWAQSHIRILSGLYGVLRPCDAMQAYRLEMGTRLTIAEHTNLYQFWGDEIAKQLRKDLESTSSNVVVNLASQEYFKAVATKKLTATLVECVFEQKAPSGAYKVISFSAKKARGLMARYAIVNAIDQAEGLKNFSTEGYTYQTKLSSANHWIFRQK